MKKVFIDGSAGTTGLRIVSRLSQRRDLELITLPEALRKDTEARRDAMNRADVVILCLPDDAARQAVTLVENPDTAVIDTSTAHRTAPGWVYGFAELAGRREKIRGSRRIANPGCHAIGFISLVAPLVQTGVLSAEAELSCFSLTGYSGGGKKMIAQYEADAPDALLAAPRQYGLSQTHKHLPEMQQLCGLKTPPIFCPIVAPYYAGMEVTVPLFRSAVGVGPEALAALYRDYYRCGVVSYRDGADEAGFLSAAALSGTDGLQISVFGDARMILTARFDNLGKGASGSAIQNLNLLLGAEETAGLRLA